MQREWFVFYQSFLEAWKDLWDVQRLQFFDKVLSYWILWECSTMDPIVETLFKLVKPQLDANNKKKKDWDKWKKYWKLGWRPKKNPSGVIDENPSGDKKITPNDKDKVKDNDKDIEFFTPTEEWKKEMWEFLWPDFVQSFKIPLGVLWYMVLGGYKLEKSEKSVREEIKRLKEKAEIYWYKLPTWEIDRWMMRQKFDHCLEWWKNKWKEMKSVKNAFITFLSNNAINK